MQAKDPHAAELVKLRFFAGLTQHATGGTTKTVTIEDKGDSKREPNETIYVDLFGLSTNALFTKNRGLGTILNDE